MNCKQGDLAIVVHSWAGNEGRLVTCERIATAFDKEQSGCHPDYYTWVCWFIEPPLRGTFGLPMRVVPDFDLRPIRGLDGEDEILTLVGKPEAVTA